jgi:hypothetical protein
VKMLHYYTPHDWKLWECSVLGAPFKALVKLIKPAIRQKRRVVAFSED